MTRLLLALAVCRLALASSAVVVADEPFRPEAGKFPPLEKALAYIQDDELVEVTPENIRLRKVHLDPNDRKRLSRAKEDA